MNRENKRRSFEKGYYKTHACNDTFTCKVCGRPVVPEGAGSKHRNHCPNCLTSLHVDIEPGDRASDCGGHMEPISVWWISSAASLVVHDLPYEITDVDYLEGDALLVLFGKTYYFQFEGHALGIPTLEVALAEIARDSGVHLPVFKITVGSDPAGE